PVAEAWDLLRSDVLNDTRLSGSARENILSIIDSNESDDAKEAKLSAMNSWRYLYANYFRRLRFAEIHATVHADAGSIMFPCSSAKVDEDYQSNSAAIDGIMKQLAGRDASEISAIRVVSSTSPEGPASLNNSIALKRGNALRNYIIAKYPALAGKISVLSAGEAWDDLRSAVDSDNALSDDARSEILSIIVSPATADEKEAKLRALPEWGYLFNEVFPGLRYARASLELNCTPAEPALPATKPADSTDKIHYHLNSATIDAGAFNNEAALKSITDKIDGMDLFEISAIRILSSTSPDGPVGINERLSLKRGQALRDYILEKYPALAGKISVLSAGEAWDDLRSAVDSDNALSDDARSEILSIIVSPAAADEKEAKLRALPEWDHLFKEVFPGLRNARAEFEINRTPAEPALPATEPADSTVIIKDTVAIADTIAKADTIAVADTVVKQVVAPVDSVPVTKVISEEVFDRRTPAVAVSTNLLLDAITALNVSVAVPIGDKWSVRAEYINPWWVWDNNARAFQIQQLNFGARYYPGGNLFGLNLGDRSRKRILTGWYLEGMFGTGKYDIEPFEKGWQGEDWLLQVGGGYSFRLGAHWSLDLGIGFGAMQTKYRYYEGNNDNSKLIYKYSGHYSWMGPTNVRASLTYLFYFKNRKAARRLDSERRYLREDSGLYLKRGIDIRKNNTETITRTVTEKKEVGDD
nr:DUF3575 domain-containing protein [Bacteroidales bacterium]